MDRSLPVIRRGIAAAFLVLLSLALTACASSATQLQPAGQAAAAPRDADQGTGSGQGSGAEQPAASAAPGSGSGGGSAGSDGGGSANGAFRDLARIVYTGSMSIRVDDLASVRSGREAVLAAGGYVGASRQTTDEERETASITYRIPAETWEATLEALRGVGAVIGEQIDSSEVTGQIVDLQARVRNLRVSEAAIQAIAEKAATFEEILEGQARLSAVREEIEQLDAQLANLEAQADLGTLTVTYGTEVVAVVEAAEAARWDAGGEVARATNTLVDMLQGLASVGIWFGIVWLPVLVVLLGIAIAVRVVLRRTDAVHRLTREPAQPTLPGA